MYLEDYKRWAAAELEDPDLTRELKEIAGDDEQIKDRFAVALKFGTAGLRGVLGAGTNRMNIYVVRQATPGPCQLGENPGRQPECCHLLRQPHQLRCIRQDRCLRAGRQRHSRPDL